MKSIPKQYLIVAAGVIALIVLGTAAFFLSKSSPQEVKKEEESVFEEPSEEIPTVDSSVKASIKGKTEALVTVTSIPEGTEEIEYELSYNTKSGSIEGVFGTITPEGTKGEAEVTFGTCSSGVCRYHDIDGPVNGTFVFSGSYGQQMLTQEFAL